MNQNSYLSEKIGQIRRDEFVAEASVNRLAGEGKVAHARPSFWSGIRAALAAAVDDPMPFLPRFADYPTRY